MDEQDIDLLNGLANIPVERSASVVAALFDSFGLHEQQTFIDVLNKRLPVASYAGAVIRSGMESGVK